MDGGRQAIKQARTPDAQSCGSVNRTEDVLRSRSPGLFVGCVRIRDTVKHDRCQKRTWDALLVRWNPKTAACRGTAKR